MNFGADVELLSKKDIPFMNNKYFDVADSFVLRCSDTGIVLLCSAKQSPVCVYHLTSEVFYIRLKNDSTELCCCRTWL